VEKAYKNPDDRIVIRVMRVVGEFFNYLEEVVDEAVIDLQQILEAETLHTGHFVHQLKQRPVKPWVGVLASIDEFQQPRETCLLHHFGKGCLVCAAIEQEEAGYDVERLGFFFLQEAVNDLGAHVILVVDKYVACE
jgi:hypothetical protein